MEQWSIKKIEEMFLKFEMILGIKYQEYTDGGFCFDKQRSNI
jgi:hypothetical protein